MRILRNDLYPVQSAFPQLLCKKELKIAKKFNKFNLFYSIRYLNAKSLPPFIYLFKKKKQYIFLFLVYQCGAPLQILKKKFFVRRQCWLVIVAMLKPIYFSNSLGKVWWLCVVLADLFPTYITKLFYNVTSYNQRRII